MLLEATVIVLARRGYEATTTNHIADAAGVSIGTLYHYFPSKEALIEAVVHDMWARELGVLTNHADALATGPLEAAIRGVVRDLVALVAARRELYRVWYAEASHLGRLDTGLAMTDRAVSALRAAMDRQTARVRPRDTAFAADLVVKTALAMVRTGARDYAREMESGQLAEELADMLTRYLLPDDAPAAAPPPSPPRARAARPPRPR